MNVVDVLDLLFYVDDHKLRIPSDRAWYYEEETCVLLVQPSDNNFWILICIFTFLKAFVQSSTDFLLG